ncbi:DoxX family protein [Sinomicrobium sp.]
MKKSNLSNIGLALLRIVPSVLLMTHGFGKVQMLFQGGEIQFPNPLGLGTIPSLVLASLAEFIAPIFIILGFKARWACIPVIITMATAFFIVHGNDALQIKELALAYLTVFASIALCGPGKLSIDGR